MMFGDANKPKSSKLDEVNGVESPRRGISSMVSWLVSFSPYVPLDRFSYDAYQHSGHGV